MHSMCRTHLLYTARELLAMHSMCGTHLLYTARELLKKDCMFVEGGIVSLWREGLYLCGGRDFIFLREGLHVSLGRD